MSDCIEYGDTLITGLNGDVCIPCYEYQEHQVYLEEQTAKSELKHALANALQALKGFETGCTSSTHDRIVVEHNGNVFVLHFELSDYTLEGAVDNL